MLKAKVQKFFGLPLVVLGVYTFLYLPILILVIFSFNNNALSYQWIGFTTKWYAALFKSTEILDALKNSLIVAISTVVLSISMGATYVYYGAQRYLARFMGFFYVNVAVPEIALAVGLLSFFYFFSLPLNIVTLIACHTLLGLGYVVPIMQAHFSDLDKRIVEASMDLGATSSQVFYTVILPLVSPSLFAAGLLVFIVSFEDFTLSFFCAGASTQTLPMYIFSMIRSGASPEVAALSCIMLIVSSFLVLLFSSLQIKKTDMLG